MILFKIPRADLTKSLLEKRRIATRLTRVIFLFTLAAAFSAGFWGVAATQEAEAAAPDVCGSFNNLPQLRQSHLKMLNLLRKRNNLAALTQESRLNKVAQEYACKLASTGHFAHVGPEGSTIVTRAGDKGYKYCALAENLAKGQRNLREVMIGWVKSPGHLKNLINKDVTEVGFGAAFATGPVRRPEGVYSLSDLARGGPADPDAAPLPADGSIVWVQFFGRPWGDC